MTKPEYYSIRGERDFLHRYFIKCGGSRIPLQLFNFTLSKWLVMKGMNPQQGREQILKDLDQKFAQ
jgi:hypothetical protein